MPCDLVANKDMRCTDSGYSLPGSGQCGSMRDRTILWTGHSKGGGGVILGERRIHQDDGWCLQGRFLVHR